MENDKIFNSNVGASLNDANSGANPPTFPTPPTPITPPVLPNSSIPPASPVVNPIPNQPTVNSNAPLKGGKKNDKKWIAIVAILVVVLVLIGLVVFFLLGNKKSSSLSCKSETAKDGAKVVEEHNMKFNWKDDNGTVFQMRVDKKIVAENLSDKQKKDMMQNIAVDCIIGYTQNEKCYEIGTYDLELTTLGLDTKIERTKDNMTISSYELNGKGYEISENDISEIVKTYEENGYVCEK